MARGLQDFGVSKLVLSVVVGALACSPKSESGPSGGCGADDLGCLVERLQVEENGSPIDLVEVDTPCHGTPHLGSSLVANYVAQDPPAANGGAITNGSYVLSTRTVYTGPGGEEGPTTSTRAETVVIANDSNWLVTRQDDGGIVERFGMLFSLSGTGATVVGVCNITGTTAWSYSVVGANLEVIKTVETGTLVDVYEPVSADALPSGAPEITNQPEAKTLAPEQVGTLELAFAPGSGGSSFCFGARQGAAISSKSHCVPGISQQSTRTVSVGYSAPPNVPSLNFELLVMPIGCMSCGEPATALASGNGNVLIGEPIAVPQTLTNPDAPPPAGNGGSCPYTDQELLDFIGCGGGTIAASIGRECECPMPTRHEQFEKCGPNDTGENCRLCVCQ